MNPMQMMIQAAMQGVSPAQFLAQQAAQNPQMRQLYQMVNGKSPDELRQMADNMLRQRGTSYDQVAQQFVQQMGARK